MNTPYSENSIYISSFAKLPLEIPAAEVYKVLDVGLIINVDTEIIEGASFTLVTDEAKAFLRQMIVGYDLHNGIEPLLNKIKERFYGTSQKAVCVALNIVYEKYKIVKAKR